MLIAAVIFAMIDPTKPIVRELAGGMNEEDEGRLPILEAVD